MIKKVALMVALAMVVTGPAFAAKKKMKREMEVMPPDGITGDRLVNTSEIASNRMLLGTGCGQVGIQFRIDRGSPPDRHMLRHRRDLRADGIAIRAEVPHVVLELLQARGIGTEERVVVGRGRVLRIEQERADLADVA